MTKTPATRPIKLLPVSTASTTRQSNAESALKKREDLARGILQEQIEALRALAAVIGDSLSQAVELISSASDQMVVTGIGKSGLIARKAAATLASTGTPAIFMHPVEGVHGDLGAVGAGSVLLALSKSGHTEELVKFVQHFRRNGGKVIAVCESGASSESSEPGRPRPPRPPLAELADVVLTLPSLPEAGPLGLAPTTSTLMMLALCDVLAMVLLDAKGFSEDDFARYHPDGSLGRRLLTRTADLMHTGAELPIVQADASFNDLLLEITGKRLGMACIVDEHGAFQGVFTDGDLRRLLTRCTSPGELTAGQAWQQSRRDTAEPLVKGTLVRPETLAVDCLALMRESEITALVVSQDGQVPDGIIRLQDIVAAGLG